MAKWLGRIGILFYKVATTEDLWGRGDTVAGLDRWAAEVTASYHTPDWAASGQWADAEGGGDPTSRTAWQGEEPWNMHAGGNASDIITAIQYDEVN